MPLRAPDAATRFRQYARIGLAPESVVGELLAALGESDFVRARECWCDDAVWHLTASHQLAGDHPVDDYLALLRRRFAEHPEYAVDITDFRQNGEQGVAVHLRSEGGQAPGVASGWVLYRVVDGSITEGRAIPTFAEGRYPF